jgi:glycosyltransferase involved in cell wall biosynthesis
VTKPLISVIIPVFNTGKYLPACLDSVISQSYPALEIVCINDGSTDASGDILRQYKERDNRIVLLTQENRGASAAKNQGLALASGEFLTIVDSDDILLPQALSKMHEAIHFEDTDVVHGGYINLNHQTGRRKAYIANRALLTQPQALAALLDKTVHHDPWAKLFRRSLFVDHHLSWPESIRHSTDVLIVYQAFHFARRVQVITDLVYERTDIRPKSLTNNYSIETYVTDKIQSRVDIANFIRSQGLWKLYQDRVRRHNERFFKIGMLHRMICHAKGTTCHSMKDIVSICKSDLPEFSLTEGKIVQMIFQTFNDAAFWLIGYSTVEKKQIVHYIEDYLTELDLDNIGLTPKEQQLARTFGTTFYNRINTNKFFFLLKCLYCTDCWDMGIRWIRRRTGRAWDKLKMDIK